VKYLFVFVLLVFGPSSWAWGQTDAGTLHGQVEDPTGALIPRAQVSAISANGQAWSTTSNGSGGYEIGNLPPGRYSVAADAPGFARFAAENVTIAAGQTVQLNIALEIDVQKEKVEVQDETSQVQVNPSNNASAIILTGRDLDALPDDPDELQQDLEALAGPSAGPNDAQMYIDGFTAGQLPPKSSIREIRISQNPFSAEYDKLGYGRIEIFTKPGTDKYHGQISVMGNSSAFNSPNPFASDVPSYDSTMYSGSISGPIRKKASFSFDFQRRNINDFAVVNAVVLDSSLNPTPFNETVSNPRTRTNLGPRLDFQLGKNNTLTVRYQYFHDTQDNAGVGQFALSSTGYDSEATEHTLQISDTQAIGSKVVNETRFQYLRENSQQTPLNAGPAISVIGAFTGGGSSQGIQTDRADHYELQNYTSVAAGNHLVKFGGRLRLLHDESLSGQGFNGEFTFPSIEAYQNAEQILAEGSATAPGASQFSLTASPSGTVPQVKLTTVDAGLYAQDDWRLRPNFTLSYGLRFETQNDIADHADLAPRIAFAWGVDGSGKNAPKTVLRGGFGMFYDRFTEDLILNAERMNGLTQQQYIVSATAEIPIDFYPQVPPPASLPASQTASTVRQISPDLHAAYIMQSAVSVERQITHSANLAVSYLNSRGVHQYVSQNTNAPLPGTPYSAGPRPDPSAGNVYQYGSGGVFRQNQLIANLNVRVGAKLSLFGYYALNYANSDTSGASAFPSNQYDLALDYGRASFDVRHKLFFGGMIALPRGFRLSPFMIVNSGTPYNVTIGQDLNGDSQFNDRPAFASPAAGCMAPTDACYYSIPGEPYAPIPVNYLTGPTHYTLNLRLSKTFGFGPETGGTPGNQGPAGHPHGVGPGGGGFGRSLGGGGFGLGSATGRRYGLTFSVNARNVLNHVNAATPIGNLESTLFAQSNALAGGPFSSGAANRKIELQAAFSF
jgi:hypothetical protein